MDPSGNPQAAAMNLTADYLRQVMAQPNPAQLGYALPQHQQLHQMQMYQQRQEAQRRVGFSTMNSGLQ